MWIDKKETTIERRIIIWSYNLSPFFLYQPFKSQKFHFKSLIPGKEEMDYSWPVIGQLQSVLFSHWWFCILLWPTFWQCMYFSKSKKNWRQCFQIVSRANHTKLYNFIGSFKRQKNFPKYTATRIFKLEIYFSSI